MGLIIFDQTNKVLDFIHDSSSQPQQQGSAMQWGKMISHHAMTMILIVGPRLIKVNTVMPPPIIIIIILLDLQTLELKILKLISN